MSLKENLPEFVSNEKYTKEILDAIEPEIDKLLVLLNSILLECCVSTCSNVGLTRYEKDYSLEKNIELSFDERKREVINKMLNKKRLTKEELANFVRRNIDGTQFYISNFAEEYKFEVAIIDPSYEEKLYKALFKARPAHLLFSIKVTSYQRRCGTFSCNQHCI